MIRPTAITGFGVRCGTDFYSFKNINSPEKQKSSEIFTQSLDSVIKLWYNAIITEKE